MEQKSKPEVTKKSFHAITRKELLLGFTAGELASAVHIFLRLRACNMGGPRLLDKKRQAIRSYSACLLELLDELDEKTEA